MGGALRLRLEFDRVRAAAFGLMDHAHGRIKFLTVIGRNLGDDKSPL